MTGSYKEVLIMEKLICVKATPNKGLGVFATRDILKDEIMTEFKGPFVKIERLEGIPREVQDHLFNVGVDEYIIAREPGVRTNHSCDPNAGIIRDAFLAAMRDIKKDEEVTFDYSMIIADDWTLECACGSQSCRKIIGNYRDLPNELKSISVNLDTNESLWDMEKSMIIKALKEVNWNKSKAAKNLGISRSVLRYRLKKYNINQDAELY